jgi:hypothetical protein
MRLTEAQLATLRAQGRLVEHRINPKPVSKYKNKRTLLDGIRFDSKKEAARWEQLLLLQKAGEIHDLERQVRYPLIVKGMKVAMYVADFRYIEKGAVVVEDVKGMPTHVYKLKKLLMKALHGVEIRET